jgi:sulfoxide reductase catalytic subunit YedY
MLIRSHSDGFIHPLSSEITSPEAYATRRQLLRQWSAGAAAVGMAGWAQREAFAQGGAATKLAALPATQSQVQGAISEMPPRTTTFTSLA